MRVVIDLELEDLETLLAELLPLGGRLRPRALEVNEHGLRLRVQAPLAGEIVLTARVTSRSGELVLSDFDLEGASLGRGLALASLRRRLAELDAARGAWRAWGEADGERLHLGWRT